MRKLSPAFFVGLVVIAGAVVFVYLFGSVEKTTTSAEDSYQVYAILDDVTGLATSSRVTMAGIPVGEVVRIGIDPQQRRKARVDLRIRDDVALYAGVVDPETGRLVNSAVLTREQGSLLGDFYLEITPGAAGPQLEEGDAIPVVVSVSGIAAVLDQLEQSGDMFAKMDRIASNIEQITESLARVIGGDAGTMRLDAVLQDVATATDNIAQATTEMNQFLRTGLFENADELDRIVGNVDQLTADVARLTGSLDDSLQRSAGNIEVITGDLAGITQRNSERVDRILAGLEAGLGRAQGSIDTLDQSLANLREITSKIERGEGTIGRLVTDDHLIESVEETVDEVGDVVKSFSRLQVRVELHLEYGFLEGTTKTYVGLRLQPKPDRWYQFELIDDPRGKTSYFTTVTETNDPTLPPLLRESSVKTTDELKFSLYFAKRFHFLVARLGIIENTGGAGLDVVLLDEAVRIAFDAFAFGQDRTPHLKATAQVRLFDHLMLLAGVDDIADGAHRDYFLGLGLTFTDDDLKALLTVAPTPPM